MVEVKLNKSNNNPFYGMKNCLTLIQNSNGTITEFLLSEAYNECKTKEQKEMFYSLLFSIGDITARQHNIFKEKKRDSGGNANREAFAVIIEWMWKFQTKQFIRFLNKGLFEEYTCLDHLLRNRVQTQKNTNKVLKVYNIFNNKEYRKVIIDHLYSIIKGNNPFNKMLVAKFLTLPRLSKRQGHKQMLPKTIEVMENKALLLKELSSMLKWEYTIHHNLINFKGYRAWRKQYNGSLESVLFSTGKIKEFKKDEFITWLDKLPSQARFRVKNRVMYSTVTNTDNTNIISPEEQYKYPTLQQWFKEWEDFKFKKQEEQRILEEKVRQNQATEEDIIKLNKVKKQAKVTVGATNFNELYRDICNNTIDKLKLESFINKVNLPYNSLVIIDDSGSMSGAPFNFATFIATVCLVKNPDDTARNLLGFFNSRTHWHSYIDMIAPTRSNWFIRREIAQTKPTPFVNPKLSFYDNYIHIKSFCNAVFEGGCTYISAIPNGLKIHCDRHPEVLDTLKSYPVWTIISDGMWNQLSSPEASINDFMRRCENYFGFKPFIVAIDICNGANLKADRFSGIDNMIYIPSNPAQIEQFLTNFKNMDVFDVYTPLQSIYRSNRYDLIRKEVLC